MRGAASGKGSNGAVANYGLQLVANLPAKMYLDEEASLGSNEIAINWNAPLVFLLAGVIAEPAPKR